tara:strand:- start:247 stop:372 length:126 start_codon:yes stop_codon:yes gene_type:complete
MTLSVSKKDEPLNIFQNNIKGFKGNNSPWRGRDVLIPFGKK